MRFRSPRRWPSSKSAVSPSLLDINLPDISGLDILGWISGIHIPTSVIMVSGDDSIDSAIQALRYGAVEFVRKPVTRPTSNSR
ncbi:MAG: response regulator [Rhodocyclaceae bacterium]|nr:response regulator [Rhodocyclaceae bacterium]